jgi:hypothetical protein
VALIFHVISFFLKFIFITRTKCSKGSPKGLVALLFPLFYIILVYSHNTHQVLVGLPQGIGGLAILFYFVLF